MHAAISLLAALRVMQQTLEPETVRCIVQECMAAALCNERCPMQVKLAGISRTFTPASCPRKRAKTNGSAAKPDFDLEELALPTASTLTFVSSGKLPTELPDVCAAAQ